MEKNPRPFPLKPILIFVSAISIILAGYFIYQTKELQKRLAPIESSQLPTPVESTPTPTCRPRPACLDMTPACKLPESPDMCPRNISSEQSEKITNDLRPQLVKEVTVEKVDPSSILVGIGQLEGNFASGTFNVLLSDGGTPSAVWYAVLQNNTWKLVLVTQEVPQCSKLQPYNFPPNFTCSK